MILSLRRTSRLNGIVANTHVIPGETRRERSFTAVQDDNARRMELPVRETLHSALVCRDGQSQWGLDRANAALAHAIDRVGAELLGIHLHHAKQRSRRHLAEPAQRELDDVLRCAFEERQVAC